MTLQSDSSSKSVSLLSSSQKIALVAHDAGAANHIAAWLRKGYLPLNGQIQFCLSGPAERIIKDLDFSLENKCLEDVLENCSVLLSGTGWASDLEHRARLMAAQRGLRSIAVIDHWTNYNERFIREGTVCVAGEIWTTDPIAFQLAGSTFPNVAITLQPNAYLEYQKEAVLAHDVHHENRLNEASRVLFLMEPIRDAWVNSGQLGEIQAFRFFLESYPVLPIWEDRPIQVVIKPHPSDPPGKYEQLVGLFGSVTVRVDEGTPLSELISWSEVVVGCQTYAMVVALVSGRKVISALPSEAPPCVLPHGEIFRLSEFVKQAL